jgi:MFS family permease
MVLPLALAQFVASYAGTNMNVAITTIADDIGTTVIGMQTTITLFTLTMAALMIPGSKLTDIWGRKTCFLAGLIVYGCGALLASFAQGLGLMIFGYSLLEGIGSALMIPPIYILITVTFKDTGSRARYFGVVSGAAGLGAAAGPLIGGLVTSAISWRASFGLQVLIVVTIILMALRITDPPRTQPAPRFDLLGAILSAAGLFFVVGILQSSTYGWFASRTTLRSATISPSRRAAYLRSGSSPWAQCSCSGSTCTFGHESARARIRSSRRGCSTTSHRTEVLPRNCSSG